jgi:ABC-type spermidine/putrescine transport system permease subunit II
MMNTETLKALEVAIEPYRSAGFIITSQSEGAITLAYPREKFSYIVFLVLLLIWPLAVLYLISFNHQGSKHVCLRVTSQGQVEESGYTLAVANRARRRARWVNLFLGVLLVAVLLAVALLFFSLSSKG